MMNYMLIQYGLIIGLYVGWQFGRSNGLDAIHPTSRPSMHISAVQAGSSSAGNACGCTGRILLPGTWGILKQETGP